MARRPVDRYTKDELPPGAPKPEDAIVEWNVHNTIHAWREELDQDLIEQLVEAGSKLMFKKHAAFACGVRPERLNEWLDEGMRADAPSLYQQLCVRFHACQSAQQMSLLMMVARAAAGGEYGAATWLLSHRFTDWADKKGIPPSALPVIEPETQAPELSAKERRQQAIEAMRAPRGELLEMMKEAGVGPIKKDD